MLVCVKDDIPSSFLETVRKRLSDTLEKEKFNLQSGAVLKVSQQLDNIILNWYSMNDPKPKNNKQYNPSLATIFPNCSNIKASS